MSGSMKPVGVIFLPLRSTCARSWKLINSGVSHTVTCPAPLVMLSPLLAPVEALMTRPWALREWLNDVTRLPVVML